MYVAENSICWSNPRHPVHPTIPSVMTKQKRRMNATSYKQNRLFLRTTYSMTNKRDHSNWQSGLSCKSPVGHWLPTLIVNENACAHWHSLTWYRMDMVELLTILTNCCSKNAFSLMHAKYSLQNKSHTFFNHFCCQKHVYHDLDVYYTHEWLVYLISSKNWTLKRGTDAGMMVIKLVFGQVYGHLLSVKLFLATFTPNTVLMVINGSINTLFLLW